MAAPQKRERVPTEYSASAWSPVASPLVVPFQTPVDELLVPE